MRISNNYQFCEAKLRFPMSFSERKRLNMKYWKLEIRNLKLEIPPKEAIC